MFKAIKYIAVIAALAIVILPGCRKQERKGIPVLTTLTVSAITADSALSGGTISDNGGDYVMNGGVCFSETNPLPTIKDDSTKANILDAASFSSTLRNLKPNTSYYVRAYAINSVGIGYGSVVTFTSGNAAPKAGSVTISGAAEVGKTLTVSYTYTDFENDPESGSIIKWYIANDGTGAGETVIAAATATTYTIEAADQGKYIRAGVTPGASSGTGTGVEVKSAFVGAVGEATTITFMYNGQSVTYGILTSPVTNRKWLDRNLGAPNAPTAANDWANYGDLFQWGRAADGHQLVNRASTSAATTGVNGVTDVLSGTDDPGHALFIYDEDWRNSPNDNLWQGVNGINNPCPAGWRLPTQAEFAAEKIDRVVDGYPQLKITFTGQRRFIDGNFSNVTTRGAYWVSDPRTLGQSASMWFSSVVGGGGPTADSRGTGNACRCIKN